MECKFYEQLQRVLGSSASSVLPEITYDVEEIIDEDESQDGDEDLQFVGQTSRLEIGTVSCGVLYRRCFRNWCCISK